MTDSQRLNDIFKDKEEFERVLHKAYENAAFGFETEFVRDVGEKYQKWGFQMFFSKKQEETLDLIAYKEE